MLDDILRSAGCLHPSNQVAGLEITRTRKAGRLGRVNRIVIRYAAPTETAPASLILKLPVLSHESGHGLAGVEARFYRQHGQIAADLRIPQVYYGEIDEEAGSSCVLMEDLGDEGFIPQANGCDATQATLAIRTIAALHAGWWNRDASGLDWIRSTERSGVLEFCRHWIRSYSDPWPESLGDVPARLSADIDSLARRLGRMPRTLVHGDFHSENLCFVEDATAGASLALVDFQFVQFATGMVDVARFVATSLTAEVRRAIESELLHLYHDSLLDRGAVGYGFEQCVDDFRAALNWNVVAPLALHVMAITTRGKQWPAELPLLQRALTAMDDWDSLTAL